MDIWLVTLIVSQMAFIVAIFAIVFHYMSKRAQRRAELQARILEKFESPQELADFLASEQGKGLLRFLAPPSRGRRGSMVTGLKGGVVLLFLGLGFLATRVSTGIEGMTVPALLCMALGLGLVVAASLGHWLGKGGNGNGQDHLADLTE